MTDQEFRLECLRLAEQNEGKNTSSEIIVSKANVFYQFLVTEDMAQEHTKTREERVNEMAGIILGENSLVAVQEG